ncbi:MAG: alpha/beta hydrolase, partial [Candidatus Beckwithbacteria bacterium]
GTISSWQEAGTIPQSNIGFGLIEHNGHLIIVGGYGQTGYLDKVYTALINPDGTVGTFSATTPLPEPLNSEVVKVDNKVISIGGGGVGGLLNKVYYADLNDDGTVGSWLTSANSLPLPSCCQGVAVANGYVFVTGGWMASGYLDTVYSAKLNLSSSSPSPSPIINPIVLLPGLGGSWNTQAMITGSSGGTWKKTPFMKVYDNLKNTFLSITDYIEGDTYFEFYYDWRQPLDLLADQLDHYINNTVLDNKPIETKVNLVGHSMGGMVARIYAQNYGLDKINQVVTSGSPHQGAIKAWLGWSGAEIGDYWSWEWIGLQLYLQVHKLKYASPVIAVRDLAPGLSNLMPTFDFVKDKDDQVLPVINMSGFNSYLNNLNSELLTDFKTLLTTISGKEQAADKDSVEWIKLTDRTLTDKLLGKWSDGRPDTYEYTADGDLTVLQKSALIDQASQVTVNANHVDLVQTAEGIQAILSALGLSATPITNSNEIPRNPSLVFFLHSPANLLVTAPDGLKAGEGVSNPIPNSIYSSEDKLLIIYNTLPGNYQVEVTGTESGIYHLEIGRLTNNSEIWDRTSNQTAYNQIDKFQLSFESGLQITSVNQGLELAKFRLNQLKVEINQSSLPKIKKRNIIVYIDQVIRLINHPHEKKIIQAAIINTYELRQKIDKFGQSQIEWKSSVNEIGEVLIQAFIQSDSQSTPKVTLKLAKQQLKGAEKTLSQIKDKVAKKISGENAQIGEALAYSETLLANSQNDFNQKNFGAAFIQALASRVIAQEVNLMVKLADDY